MKGTNNHKNTLEVKQKINCKYNQKQFFFVLRVRKRNYMCDSQPPAHSQPTDRPYVDLIALYYHTSIETKTKIVSNLSHEVASHRWSSLCLTLNDVYE